MINKKEFALRLQKILEKYELTASSFADKIDVGRSSISHVLSGRNNPSLEFIMKIDKAFPKIDLHWLIYGREKKDAGDSKTKNLSSSISSPTPPKEHATQGASATFHRSNEVVPEANEVERIIVLYKNGRFKHYDSV